MAWCYSATRLLCRKLPISIASSTCVRFIARPIAAIITRKEKYLAVNGATLLQSSRLFQDGEVTCATSDRSTSTGVGTRKYLLSMGLSLDKLGQHRSVILEQDQKKVHDVVSLLQRSGFSLDEVVTLVEKHALLLMLDQDTLQTRLSVFLDLGMKPTDIMKLSKLVLFGDLDTINANIELLQELLNASLKWISSLLKYKPHFFQNTADFPHDEIRDNIIMIRYLLLHHGCREVENVLRQIMRDDYRLFRISQGHVTLVMDYLIEQGITGADLVYVIKRSANVFQLTPELLSERMRNLQERLDLTKSELKKFVIRYPRALGMKSENLNKHIDFFEQRHILPEYIVDNPYVLWVSIKELTKRFREQKELGLLSGYTPSQIKSVLVNMVISNTNYSQLLDRLREEKDAQNTDSEMSE